MRTTIMFYSRCLASCSAVLQEWIVALHSCGLSSAKPHQTIALTRSHGVARANTKTERIKFNPSRNAATNSSQRKVRT